MSGERHAVDVPGGRLCLVLHLPDASAPAPCVVACHGLSASKDSDKYLMLAAELPAAGYALARFDFRGCGESSGVEEDTTIATRIEDVHAVLSLLTAHPRLSGRFGLLGSSLGGFVALQVAARAHVAVGAEAAGVPGGASDPRPLSARSGAGILPSDGRARAESGAGDGSPGPPGHPGSLGPHCDVRAVVTWNAPSNLFDLANDERHDGTGIGVPLFMELASHRYDTTPAGIARHLTIHGDADDVVDVEHGVVLHSRASEPCELIVIPGADHRITDPAHRRLAVDESLAWFRRFLPRPDSEETSA